MVELAELRFKTSGSRVDGLSESVEMHSGKREKHLDNPQSLGLESVQSHKIDLNETETEHSLSRSTDFFFFSRPLIFSSLLFIDLVYPGRVWDFEHGLMQ